MATNPGAKVRGRRWEFGWCEYVELSRTLKVHGVEQEIESKPLDVLELLLEQPRITLGKEYLLEMVWGSTADQSLAVAVSKLRRAFGGAREEIILTVSGVGYRMAVPVVCRTEEPHAEKGLPLAPGDAISGEEGWTALRRLDVNQDSPVWLAAHADEARPRVFKFALNGIRLRSLQREVMVSRLFQKEAAAETSWYVPIVSWNFEAAAFYLQSRFCGSNLAEWSLTDPFRSMTWEQRLELAVRLVSAVASAHALGVLHNDLKPSNILIETSEGGEGASAVPGTYQLRVSDFGAGSVLNRARLEELEITDYEATVPGEFEASPRASLIYLAPEVRAGGTPTAQADVYALGLLVFQIVSGDLTRPLSPGWEAAVPNELLAADIAAASQIDTARRLKTAWDLADRLRTVQARTVERARLDAERNRAEEAQRQLERARIRRPWMLAAVALLAVGAVVSLGLYRRAVTQRAVAERQSQTLARMYDFLSHDLLGQANPYLSAPTRTSSQETLQEAIDAALPEIDARFAQTPEIAARLHSTVADAFKGQTQYYKADAEYRAAEGRFRLAEGPHSPQAAITEFKRENAELSSRLPGTVPDAMTAFGTEKAEVAAMRSPSPELRAWEAMVAASIEGYGPHPETAVQHLSQAIQQAEAAPAMDEALVIAMRARICGLYVREGDGPRLERAARSLRDKLAGAYGANSPYLPLLDMYLQEALYLQARFADSIRQADQNLPRFERILGPRHELTLAIIGNRAASEAQLGLYARAAEDDLRLYAAERENPSGLRLGTAALADAAMNHCRSADYSDGIGEARQVLRDADTGQQAQPMLAHAAKFFLAECLVGRAESESRGQGLTDEREAEKLIAAEDPKAIAIPGSDLNFVALKELTLARSAFLRGDLEQAHLAAASASASFGPAGIGPYEKAALARLRSATAAPRPN